MRICGLEAGGTKFVLGMTNERNEITDRLRIDTKDPMSTLKAVQDYIIAHQPDAVGIACFGPLDLDPASPTYGSITSTPKNGWKDTPVLKIIQEVFKGPIGIDTDVNGAALAESLWGTGIGCDPLVYITIGTGIGAGIIVNNKPIHGLLHPEFGHIYLRSHPQDPFKGVCPYHENCFEGLASGPSLNQRWGVQADTLRQDHPAWDIEAFYIAQACVSLILTLSPKKIVLGGGVMHQTQLLPKIKQQIRVLLNGYVQRPEILLDSTLIDLPALGDNAGLMGAFALALEAIKTPSV